MYFDSRALPCVEAFVRKHYKGGSVLDFGCGCGRYTHLFPCDEYTGVDGHKENINKCQQYWLSRKFLLEDLETWKPDKQYDYLFSSVTLDQVRHLPKGWAKNYILIEPEEYSKIFKPQVDEPVEGSEGTRMMLCKTHLK